MLYFVLIVLCVVLAYTNIRQWRANRRLRQQVSYVSSLIEPARLHGKWLGVVYMLKKLGELEVETNGQIIALKRLTKKSCEDKAAYERLLAPWYDASSDVQSWFED